MLIPFYVKTGSPVWTVMTVDENKPYTITQAPRVIKGRVVIGNSGSEYGVRGYISAYDAETGALAWRFYTVPGDPAQPPENPILAEAAKTWTGEWWKIGGGGAVWESISYDPDLNLIYFGVGNGTGAPAVWPHPAARAWPDISPLFQAASLRTGSQGIDRRSTSRGQVAGGRLRRGRRAVCVGWQSPARRPA